MPTQKQIILLHPPNTPERLPAREREDWLYWYYFRVQELLGTGKSVEEVREQIPKLVAEAKAAAPNM